MMMDAIAAAVSYVGRFPTPKPDPSLIVEQLIAVEKAFRQTRGEQTFEALLGTWRLGFLTGTVNARKQAGVALGAGRFLPRWLAIRIIYAAETGTSDRGVVRNCVRFGPLELTVSGPISFHPKQGILAFDFTHLAVSMSGVEVYYGEIRGGGDRAASFHDLPLKDRAFFTYFLVEDTHIAARGKGGGLALWVRES